MRVKPFDRIDEYISDTDAQSCLLPDNREQFFGFLLHQGFVTAAFNIEPEYRFGIAHAEVKAPVGEVHAYAVGIIIDAAGIY